MATIDASAPFVLLDDARASGATPARLYRDPIGAVTAFAADEVTPALDQLRAATARGLHAAGWLAYEAGLALDPATLALLGKAPRSAPLLWFGLFERFAEIAPGEVAALLPDPAGAWAGTPRPLVSRETHAGMLAEAAALIAAGDIYQVNLTFPADVPIAGDPIALYARLRARAAAGWGGIVHDGTRWLLSFSPELFFTLADGVLTARPMKGTAPRDADAHAFAADPKQRAENLMIVDLLRNDLSRIAAAGSVAVPRLFEVETYPTIHQMTSTVTAALARGRDAIDALAALFPCGSITGAPKFRAIEVIDGIEGFARNAYTGGIGRIDAGGAGAAFNVAIRTLEIDRATGSRAKLGLGSGIVADSHAPDEWRECLAKGAFVTAGQRAFDLIETMRFDPIDGIADLDRHLARMKASADAFGFAFDRHDARNELQAATFRLREGAKVRLLLARSGRLAIETRALPAAPVGPVEVAIVPLPVAPSDFRLRHKTSDRGFYDDARRRAGTFEVLFEDPAGRLTEGSFTSLFVARGDKLVTPPLALGLLPGVLRGRLIDEGRAHEGELTRADLVDGFLIGNAVRGLLPARLP